MDEYGEFYCVECGTELSDQESIFCMDCWYGNPENE